MVVRPVFFRSIFTSVDTLVLEEEEEKILVFSSSLGAVIILCFFFRAYVPYIIIMTNWWMLLRSNSSFELFYIRIFGGNIIGLIFPLPGVIVFWARIVCVYVVCGYTVERAQRQCQNVGLALGTRMRRRHFSRKSSPEGRRRIFNGMYRRWNLISRVKETSSRSRMPCKDSLVTELLTLLAKAVLSFYFESLEMS